MIHRVGLPVETKTEEGLQATVMHGTVRRVAWGRGGGGWLLHLFWTLPAVVGGKLPLIFVGEPNWVPRESSKR